MKVEHVAFYPHEVKNLKTYSGSLHVYLIDWDMDLRGIQCFVKKGQLHIKMPFIKTSSSDGNGLNFPVVDFTNQDRKKNLMDSIKINLKAFLDASIKEYLDETLSK